MRILVIRGGAIGDFVLTLPAVYLLRKRWPDAHVECLGYPGIASLGLKRFYFDEVRAMDNRALVGFFVPKMNLDPNLVNYFKSFDVVISYIYDPDRIFRNNLLRCDLTDADDDHADSAPVSPHSLICVDPRVHIQSAPAILHFAEPLRKLGLKGTIESPRLYLSDEDETFASERVAGIREKIVALHPGSGSVAKNWPVGRWIEVARRIQQLPGWKLLITAGEADMEVLARLRKEIPGDLWVEESLNLNQLAALYSKATLFLGHDSGPGHLAAGVGTRCILLFGQTDPEIWAPKSNEVTVLRAGSLDLLPLEVVWETILQKLR